MLLSHWPSSHTHTHTHTRRHTHTLSYCQKHSRSFLSHFLTRSHLHTHMLAQTGEWMLWVVGRGAYQCPWGPGSLYTDSDPSAGATGTNLCDQTADEQRALQLECPLWRQQAAGLANDQHIGAGDRSLFTAGKMILFCCRVEKKQFCLFPLIQNGWFLLPKPIVLWLEPFCFQKCFSYRRNKAISY